MAATRIWSIKGRIDNVINYVTNPEKTDGSDDAEAANAELRRDIRRLAYFCAGRAAADIASLSAGNMDSVQLIAFKKSFEKQLAGSKGAELQLAADSADEAAESGFSMK